MKGLLIVANKKKVIENQKYEEYWKLTLEYSDIYGDKFNNTLRIIIDFIDAKNLSTLGIQTRDYKLLQNNIEEYYPKADSASTRKSINQFYKLGFVNNEGKGYHRLARLFLEEENKENKKRIFSRILYSNASFSRTQNTISNINEINFFIKTLENNKELSKEDLLALISTDFSKIPKGFLNETELSIIKKENYVNQFLDRKYNQVRFITRIFKNVLSNVYYSKSKETFYLDSSLALEEEITKRDSYLHRLYKDELLQESIKLYSKPICVFEKYSYPVLIASHIKPFRFSNESEAYDVNNGLLLSKNLDSLFDLGFISFNYDGTIIFSKELSSKDLNLVNNLMKEKLDLGLLNDKRLNYLKYHRDKILRP